MKSILPAIAVFFCASILLSACAVSKNSMVIQKPEFESTGTSSTTCFVELNDGSTRQYSSLKLVTGVLTTPHLVADNKVVINANDILAYQDNNHYAVSAKMLTSKKKGYIATEILPGFAVKLLSGKLNLYSRKYYNGANAAEEFFLQDGNEGDIVAYSKEAMKNMLKEDEKALEYFNNKSKISPKSKKILAAVELFNNSRLLTRN